MGGRGARANPKTGKHAPPAKRVSLHTDSIASGALGVGIGGNGFAIGKPVVPDEEDEFTVRVYYDQDGNFLRLVVFRNGVPFMEIEYEWEPTLSVDAERIYHYHMIDKNGKRLQPHRLTEGMMMQFGKYFKPKDPKD